MDRVTIGDDWVVLFGTMIFSVIFCVLAAKLDGRNGQFKLLQRITLISVALTVMSLGIEPSFVSAGPFLLGSWLVTVMCYMLFVFALSMFIGAISYVVGQFLFGQPIGPSSDGNQQIKTVDETGNPYQPPSM